MAANLVALRAALERMGFSQQARLYLTDPNGQGYGELSEFNHLTDEQITKLCSVTRRPGGTMPNPQAGAGRPQNIPNPGIAVPERAEDNLRLMCYYLRYKERTSRVVAAADVTIDSVRELRHHREWEDAHKDVDPPTIDPKDWPRTIEGLEEYLRGCLGVTKIPLAYVVRDEEQVPAADPVGGYGTKLDELIARAPIRSANGDYTPTFLTDRSKVWELISDITRDKDCFTYVRPAQRTRDGRMAFLGLKGHYLGENNVDNMSSRAEKKLQTTSYTGEKRRWNFEKYVKMHMDQHAILEGLTQHGYSGIDERSKVRHLLDGIKTTTLDTVKTRIMSDAALRADFQRCVNLFQDFIEQKASHEIRDVTIAAVRAEGGGHSNDDWKNVKPDMSVEDRYYKKSEYMKLSPEKKAALKIIREKRGGGKKRKSTASGKSPAHGQLSKQVKTLVSKALIAALASEDSTQGTGPTEDGSETEDDESVEMKPPATKKTKGGSNRTNPALTRRKVNG